MKRFSVIASALAFSTLVAVPAFARGKIEGNFPMAAAEFKAKVEAKQEKMRAKIEQKLAEKNAPAERVQEVRAKLADSAAKVNAEVTRVGADGVVTADEARQVHDFAKSLHPHHKKGDRAPKA